MTLVLALMSVRLGLQFDAQTTEARVREMEQVEKHMRVCILADNGFKPPVTISPSEPLLAEAARRYMSQSSSIFNMPAGLLEHLTILSLGKGGRGRLVAQVLLILAADKACGVRLATPDPNPPVNRFGDKVVTIPRAFSVTLFIKALLAEQWHNNVLSSLPAMWRTKTESSC